MLLQKNNNVVVSSTKYNSYIIFMEGRIQEHQTLQYLIILYMVIYDIPSMIQKTKNIKQNTGIHLVRQ